MKDELYKIRANQEFDSLILHERISKIFTFLKREKNELLSLEDAQSILKPRAESYRGMQAVPISLIELPSSATINPALSITPDDFRRALKPMIAVSDFVSIRCKPATCHSGSTVILFTTKAI